MKRLNLVIVAGIVMMACLASACTSSTSTPTPDTLATEIAKRVIETMTAMVPTPSATPENSETRIARAVAGTLTVVAASSTDIPVRTPTGTVTSSESVPVSLSSTPTTSATGTASPAETVTATPTASTVATGTPTATPSGTASPTATPSATPSGTASPTATPSATPTTTPQAVVIPAPATPELRVSWDTIHYNCQVRCFSPTGTQCNLRNQPCTYAYRSFHFNMKVENLTTDKTLAAYWKPTVIIRNGAAERREDNLWRWSFAGGQPVGNQPSVGPGMTVNWTFIAMLPEPGEWASAAVLEAWGREYRIDFGERASVNGWKDCGAKLANNCLGGFP